MVFVRWVDNLLHYHHRKNDKTMKKKEWHSETKHPKGKEEKEPKKKPAPAKKPKAAKKRM